MRQKGTFSCPASGQGKLMELTIFYERERRTETVQLQGATVRDLLHQLDINSETVIVVKNNEVVTEHDSLQEKDIITLFSVISGG